VESPRDRGVSDGIDVWLGLSWVSRFSKNSGEDVQTCPEGIIIELAEQIG
jgi:hypothetical protein